MKKKLLFTLSLGIGLSLFAQRPIQVSGAHKVDLNGRGKSKVDPESASFYVQATRNQGNSNARTQVAGTKFASSRNALTLLVSQSNCLTANQALNAVMFTHRINATWSPITGAPNTSGFVQHSWTTNAGSTWDSTYYASPPSTFMRYPSGAIFNPAGNTTLANAFAVSLGPWHPGADWSGNYRSSMNLTATQTNLNTFFDSVYANAFARVDIHSTATNVWVAGSIYEDVNITPPASPGYRGTFFYKATPNGNAFTWTVDSLKPAFHQDNSGVNDTYSTSHMSFSEDGQTGYIVFFGVDSTATTSQTRSFLPLTWKTTDGGVTWTRYTQNFDFTTINAITRNLIPATDGNLKPWFSQQNGSDVTVDFAGNLHIFCEVASGASDDDDSLGFTWTRTGINGTQARHFLYDVHTTSTGAWDAWVIDSLMTSPNDTTSIWYDSDGNYEIDARAQISRSTDGTKLFYTYADTDPNFVPGELDNNFPNLFARGIDLNASPLTGGTARLQITTDNETYWHYMSNIALVSGDVYTIPCTYSKSSDQSNDAETPVDHYYLNTVQFTSTSFNTLIDPQNVQEIAGVGTMQIYPNPANELLNIILDLQSAENVTIEVVNTIGQTVLSQNNDLSSGNSSIRVNTSALAPGIYFVTVTAGNSRSVEKVVIQ